MENQIEKNKTSSYIMLIFWIFTLGSIFGFLLELAYVTIIIGKFEIRQGLVHGPFIQVYGLGAMMYYILVRKVKEPWKVFLYGMLIGGATEYVLSFFQELILGNVSWDYADKLFNLNGRTSLLYTVIWGMLAVIFLKLVYPIIEKNKHKIQFSRVKCITIILMIFMTYNISISVLANTRQLERKYNVEPKGKLDQFLDKNYSDELLEKIYHNRYEM